MSVESQCEVLRYFDQQLELIIPEMFKDMNEEDVQKIYPYKKRPAVIKTDNDVKACITFDLFHLDFETEQIRRAMLNIKKVIKEAYPYSDLSVINSYYSENSKKGGWFYFNTKHKQGERYNVLYVMPICEQFMLGGMNCPMEEKEYWMQELRFIWKHIRELPKQNGYLLSSGK